jgi:hypothetical protein
LNPRPLGYEPNELPDCSTPRQKKPYCSTPTHVVQSRMSAATPAGSVHMGTGSQPAGSSHPICGGNAARCRELHAISIPKRNDDKVRRYHTAGERTLSRSKRHSTTRSASRRRPASSAIHRRASSRPRGATCRDRAAGSTTIARGDAIPAGALREIQRAIRVVHPALDRMRRVQIAHTDADGQSAVHE